MRCFKYAGRCACANGPQYCLLDISACAMTPASICDDTGEHQLTKLLMMTSEDGTSRRVEGQ